MKKIVRLCLLLFYLSFSAHLIAQKPKEWQPLTIEQGGRIVRHADKQGNLIPDYSYAGYKQSDQPIPNLAVKQVITPINGDATSLIQHALDEVGALPQDASGFRGAVLLQPGIYTISGSLKMKASGVVLRGSGTGAQGTILLATGFSRETVITMLGKADTMPGKKLAVTDSFVPVDANTLRLENTSALKAGDAVWIKRPSTQKWINDLGTDHFGGGITALGWKPGEHEIKWDRIITNVKGNTVTLNAPLTLSLDAKYGGGFLVPYQWAGRLTESGIENLTLQSTYDSTNPKDEAHRWMAITINDAKDCWVRQVTFKNFAGSAVLLGATTSRVTVEDCIALNPVSELGGWRRHTFFTAGQQTLFQRCYAEYSMHPFATGFCAAGPNAFVQCEAYRPYSFSGGIQSMSPGVLFDVVAIDAQAIQFTNLGQDGNGAGWNTANSMLWNCSAAKIENWQTPSAQNWSYGSWAQFNGTGYWAESNNHLNPRSLFYALLAQRLGRPSQKQSFIFDINTSASSSPTVEVAAELTEYARKPAATLLQWIEKAANHNPIPIDANGVALSNAIFKNNKAVLHPLQTLSIRNGWLVVDNQLAIGSRFDVQWWSGSLRPGKVEQSKPHITRFVPGYTGSGFTDDLDAVVKNMVERNALVLEHNYGLWYDRRRDDHQRVRRMDGDVWAPFYELPFARSGEGQAYDGLSLYDLTKPNHWYWNRLSTFAKLAEENGRILLQQHYFQHNIIEAGAHYADFPWRTANNINQTPFPEPVPYAGDKRVFMDEWFYDTSNTVLNTLHRKFIRQSLSNFKGQHNVIHSIGAEYTGPVHFVQFWLDVIAGYEKETGEDVLIALSTTKDVQDAILTDAKRAAVVDIIDIRYWHYEASGNAYAPLGGQHLAPRQHARLLKPKSTSAEQVYRAVSEYKKQFPQKAVMYSGDGYDKYALPVLMAGGSLAPFRQFNTTSLLQKIEGMKPDFSAKEWTLTGKDEKLIYLSDGNTSYTFSDASFSGKYTIDWISAGDGKIIKTEEKNLTGKVVTLNKPQSNIIMYIRKESGNKKGGK